MLAQGSFRFIVPPLVGAMLLIFFEVYVISILFIGVAIYMAWFFRDPKREIKIDKNVLYAAADGLIKEISKEDGMLKIAIRMSPFDVHLNRSPSSAKITNIIHKPGSHKTVYFAGAEDRNEQNLISLENDLMEIDILQITGAFARRIECWVEKGSEIEQGQKIGIIRFGSQTNMLFKPKNQVDIDLIPIVEIDESVQAGLTPVAKIQRSNNE